MSDEEGNVVDLLTDPIPHQRDANPMGVVRGEPCEHIRVVADTESRQLECGRCGATVDPFDWLVARIGGWNKRFDHSKRSVERGLNSARAEARHLRCGIEELKREKRNLQAQTRRLKAKVGNRG